jgi:hypothetical protein
VVVQILGAVSRGKLSALAEERSLHSAARWTITPIGAVVSAVFAVAAASLSLSGLSGCGGTRSVGAVPVPSVSSSLAAQEAFRRIESRFSDLSPDARPALEHDLREFLEKYRADDRSRVARLYLAWIELGRKRTAEARALAAPVRRGPPGAVHDFADVVEAAAERREGRAGEALGLLEPLRGKIADPLERGLYSEELVHALVDKRRADEAIRAMLDWAEQAPPSDRETVVASIEALIREMPPAALEAGLRSLAKDADAEASATSATRAEARRWLFATARGRLVRAALTARDPELAKRLVESSPSAFGHDDSREALDALAATSAVAPRIAGRSVGVVLDVVDEPSRNRSADLVAGMTRALGLPTSATREDAVRLVTHDASEPGDMQHALGILAGDGAAILVAGVTDEAAIAASLFAERTQIPVIVLRRPAALGEKGRFTFVLGADTASEEAAVAEALAAGAARNPVRVGPGGFPCDAAPSGGGQTRFPAREWKHKMADALVLLGDESCTKDAIAEAGFEGLTPLLVIGLESGRAEVSGRKAVLTSGRFPLGTRPLIPEERAWIARWGASPSWYETLGHDAATLSASALASFPLARAVDAPTVTALHLRARDQLARVEAKLWSTGAAGFGSMNVVPREIHALASVGTPGPP